MKYFINLFPEKEKDLVDNIMYFAFHYLRYILVITQFVVICVFFFRFKVDQEIVDLKDGLQQKKQIILATKPLLGEVAFLEEKTQEVSGITDKQDAFAAMMTYFIDSVPADVTLTALNIDQEKIMTEGYSLNPASIQQYKDKLILEKRFEEVNLVNVRKTDLGFSFSLNVSTFNYAITPTQ